MKLYHGTSFENWQRIQLMGFDAENTVWNCSEPNTTYFWNPDRMVEKGECETIEEATDRAIQSAFESAQITAALFGSTNENLIVIECEVDAEYIDIDESCENMDLAVCVVNCKHESIKAFYTSPYYPDLRIFYLKGLSDNQWLKHYILPEMTQKALEILPSDVYLYDLLKNIEVDNRKEFAQ